MIDSLNLEIRGKGVLRKQIILLGDNNYMGNVWEYRDTNS
jgi:hypothetical protein